MANDGEGVGAVIVLLVLLVLALFVGCTDEKTAQRVLSNDGFTEITMTGFQLFACGDDWYATGFEATKNGKRIRGTVCSGLLFKNATIRYE